MAEYDHAEMIFSDTVRYSLITNIISFILLLNIGRWIDETTIQKDFAAFIFSSLWTCFTLTFWNKDIIHPGYYFFEAKNLHMRNQQLQQFVCWMIFSIRPELFDDLILFKSINSNPVHKAFVNWFVSWRIESQNAFDLYIFLTSFTASSRITGIVDERYDCITLQHFPFCVSKEQ